MSLAVLFFLLIAHQVSCDYTLEVALLRWANPLRSSYFNRCCDSAITNPSNCTDDCETRFHICPQPFSFNTADNSCPYGRYSTRPYSSLSDKSDSTNIMFTFGVVISGNIPNPMSFNIDESISAGLRITVTVDDQDETNSDDLIDIIRFLINPPINITNTFQELPSTQGRVGTLQISYRIRCRDGFYGDTCNQYNCTGVYSKILAASCNNQGEYISIISLLVTITILCMVSLVTLSTTTWKAIGKTNTRKSSNSVKLRESINDDSVIPYNTLPPLTPTTNTTAANGIRKINVSPLPPVPSSMTIKCNKDTLPTNGHLSATMTNTFQNVLGIKEKNEEGIYTSLGSITNEEDCYMNPDYSGHKSLNPNDTDDYI